MSVPLRPVAAPDVVAYEEAIRAPDPGRRTLAHLLATVHAAVPARSIAIVPVDRAGQPEGTALVLRTGQGPIVADTARGHFPASADTDTHRVRVVLRGEGRPIATLQMVRSSDQPAFHDRELSFLRHAQPMFEHVCALALRTSPGFDTADLLTDAGLTPREAEVAQHVASGMRSREIAELLVLSEATVKTHLARVFSKLGVRTRAELAARLRPVAGYVSLAPDVHPDGEDVPVSRPLERVAVG